MPENTVRITNVETGETIPTQFDISVDFTNQTNASARIELTCPGVNIQPVTGLGSKGDVTLAFTHPQGGPNHTITATLKEETGMTVISTDDVEDVTVTDQAPVTVDATKQVKRKLAEVDPTANLSGDYDPAVGNGIILLVEKPGKKSNGKEKRRPIKYVAPAAQINLPIPNSNRKRWTNPSLGGGFSGHHLRVVLTMNGTVKAIIRAILT